MASGYYQTVNEWLRAFIRAFNSINEGHSYETSKENEGNYISDSGMPDADTLRNRACCCIQGGHSVYSRLALRLLVHDQRATIAQGERNQYQPY